MRAAFAAGLLPLLFALGAAAGESAWRAAPLPPEAERLNRLADVAASSETAAQLYGQSLRLCRTNGPALYGLGRALLDLDRAADGLKVFQRLDALYPDDPAVLEALATAHARLPEPRRADLAPSRGCAERAGVLNPAAPEAWHEQSVLRHLDGDYAAALEAAREAVARDAQNPSDAETTALYQQQETACNDALSVFSPLD